MVINKSKFSKRAKVSRAAITRACQSGALVIRPDGKLDTDNPVNRDYIVRNQSKNKKSKDGSSQATEPSPATPEKKESIFLSGDMDFDKLNHNLEALSISSIDKLKVISQTRQIQIKTKKERQELISRELISKVFAKLYMVDVNELRTLGANLAPEIAALAAIDDDEIIIKVGEAIEKEVFAVLQHIKRIVDDFLKTIKAKELE